MRLLPIVLSDYMNRHALRHGASIPDNAAFRPVSPCRRGLVLAPFSRAHAGASPGLAGDQGGRAHADRRAHGFGQDARGLPLAAIDGLVRQGLAGTLTDATQIVYVSPLKALSNDIQKNLEAPIAGIRAALEERGLPDVDIRTWVRTGDTPSSERAKMAKRPPHIVVTTPESFYILLGSESGRKMLETTRWVIVDEIHAMAGTSAACTWRSRSSVSRHSAATSFCASVSRRRKSRSIR